MFSLEDSSPNRVLFDLERVMRTKYVINDFQQTYFVIESFERLLRDCEQDFAPLYERLGVPPELEAHEFPRKIASSAKGDLHYFRAKNPR